MRFAQSDALDGVERSALAKLAIHLRKRTVAFDQPQQSEKIGQRVFERAVEREQRPVTFSRRIRVLSSGAISK